MVNLYRYPCNKENSSCLTFPGKCSCSVVVVVVYFDKNYQLISNINSNTTL